MPNHGRILTHSPLNIPGGATLTIKAPKAGPLTFVRGATFVAFRLGASAEITVVPSGIRHMGDYEISLDFPHMGAGTYRCLVTSKLDLAETATPVAGAGMAASAPGSYGAILSQPSPAQAKPGDIVTITAPGASSFVFDPAGVLVTFSGRLEAIYQATVPPRWVNVLDAKGIRVAVPKLPPGAYAVTISSGGKTAECSGPQVVVDASGAVPARETTPAPDPMRTLPSGDAPTTRITIHAPFSRTPLPSSSLTLGPGLPPIYVSMAKASLFDKLALGIGSRFRTKGPGESSLKHGWRLHPTPPAPSTGAGPKAETPVAALTEAPPVMTAPTHYRDDNAVEYLLREEVVFQRMTSLVAEVVAAPRDAGYLHTVFPVCDDQAMVADGKRFLDLVQAAGAAGKEVKVLLWYPALAQNGAAANVRRINERCKQQIDALRLPGVEVQLLPHALPFGAQQQTLFIAGLGDRAKILVASGGMESPEAGRTADPGDHRRGAIVLSGQAVKDAEAQWGAMWELTQGGRPKGPSPVPKGGTQSVFAAVTAPPRLSLRDELIARLESADHFVYMESRALFDPEVVSALGLRIKAKRDAIQPFQVLLLVPHQARHLEHAWLHYLTFCHLSFMSCDGFTFDDNGTLRSVSRDDDGREAWHFSYSGTPFGIGNWFEDSAVTWDTGTANVKSLRGFVNETLMYSLERCTGEGKPNALSHIGLGGNLAIIDDAFVAISTGAFTPRTMRQDDALAVFVHGDSVPALRAALWGEYFGGATLSPGEWWGAVRENLRSSEAGKLAPGQLYVMPLRFSPSQQSPSGTPMWLGMGW